MRGGQSRPVAQLTTGASLPRLGGYFYAWGRWLLELWGSGAAPESELMRRLSGTPQTEA